MDRRTKVFQEVLADLEILREIRFPEAKLLFPTMFVCGQFDKFNVGRICNFGRVCPDKSIWQESRQGRRSLLTARHHLHPPGHGHVWRRAQGDDWASAEVGVDTSATQRWGGAAGNPQPLPALVSAAYEGQCRPFSQQGSRSWHTGGSHRWTRVIICNLLTSVFNPSTNMSTHKLHKRVPIELEFLKSQPYLNIRHDICLLHQHIFKTLEIYQKN